MGRARTTLAAIALCRAIGCTDPTEVLIPSDAGGEPGDGGSPNADAGIDPPSHPVIVAISTKIDATCALTQEASLYCWGETFGVRPMSVDVNEVVALSVGQSFVCALVSAGPVRCFPEQSDGVSLGRQGSNDDVAAGGDFACALVGQTVECWGTISGGSSGMATCTPKTFLLRRWSDCLRPSWSRPGTNMFAR